MTTMAQGIADKVRGVAAEQRMTQQGIAEALGLSRTSVAERFNGRVPFTGPELHRLASEWNVPITRLFPDPHVSSVPEAMPPVVSVTEAPNAPALDAAPDPAVEGGRSSASASTAGVGAEDSSAA